MHVSRGFIHRSSPIVKFEPEVSEVLIRSASNSTASILNMVNLFFAVKEF